jgi:phospholipid transport system substrate-binding protein
MIASVRTGRRAVIRQTVAIGLLLTMRRVAVAQGDAGATAADFIRRVGNELPSLVDAAAGSPAERARLQAFIDRVADVDGVARFCLGRFWTAASASQRRAYLAAFHLVLLRNVTSWLGNHRTGSAHVTIEKPLAAGQDIDVPTIVDRGGDPPAHITWVVTQGSGDPKIIDLVVEGVSLRLTVRNDYGSFIAHNNGDVGALIRALEQQANPG